MTPEDRDATPVPNGANLNPENLGVSGHNRRQLSPEELASMEAKVRKVELAISLVLRIGVILSVIVVGVGLGLMFSHHVGYSTFSGHVSYKSLTSSHSVFPHSFTSLGRSIARGHGSGIVVAGVLLLILTPVARVAVGVLSFLYEKDIPMALITLFVLFVLIASFFLASV